MRIYSILKDFIDADQYLNLQYLADKYQVSKRTIQNDISYLLTMASRKGYQLRQQRGAGYLLEITNEELFHDFVAKLAEENTLGSTNRVENILAYIAVQPDYISMDYISVYFQISKTSVKNYMKEVEDLAKHYKVNLEKKSHYGIHVDKDTSSYKEMLVEMFFNKNIIIQETFKKYLQDFEVYNFLFNQCNKEQQNINYSELKNVYVFIQALIVHAHLQKQTSYQKEWDMQDPIARMAWNMKDWIEQTYHIEIGLKSLDELQKVLQKNIRMKTIPSNFEGQLESDIDEFLAEVDEIHNTSFQEDQLFKQRLLDHVSLLISRFYQKISYKNTMLNEICIRHPMIFNIAISFSNMLKTKYNVVVTEDEAAFIAIHFAGHMEKEKKAKLSRYNRVAIVCSSGAGVAYLLKLQLEGVFKKEEVETFSFLDLENLEEFQPDIIFTIMPLEKEFNVPIIQIHELLDKEDLLMIQKFLEYDHIDQLSLLDKTNEIDEIFNKNYFKVGNEKNYIDLLTKMADELSEHGVATMDFTHNVLERESYMSTIFFNGVAIPHPIQLCSYQNVISVYILEKPIIHNDKEVRIVFMISLRQEDYNRYKDITKLFYRLMQDEQAVKKICRSKSFENMIVILKEMKGTLI